MIKSLTATSTMVLNYKIGNSLRQDHCYPNTTYRFKPTVDSFRQQYFADIVLDWLYPKKVHILGEKTFADKMKTFSRIVKIKVLFR